MASEIRNNSRAIASTFSSGLYRAIAQQSFESVIVVTLPIETVPKLDVIALRMPPSWLMVLESHTSMITVLDLPLLTEDASGCMSTGSSFEVALCPSGSQLTFRLV